MSSVGEMLRRERLGRELSLDKISRETKIPTRLLEALENDQYDRLPPEVFARSFAKQYARYLGLDENQIAAEVSKAVNPAADLPRFAALEPEYKVPPVLEWEGARSHSSLLPALVRVLMVMLVCAGVYAWWLRGHNHPTRAIPAVPAARKVEPPPVPAPPSTVTQPPATRTLHVALTADSPVWVHVWADNNSLFEGVLEPGTEKAFDASDLLRIRTGNAGDLHVTVNGKSAGDIGPKGQIRIVEITPQSVQILPPPPKPAAPAPEPL